LDFDGGGVAVVDRPTEQVLVFEAEEPFDDAVA
jgi:hypothetical protein